MSRTSVRACVALAGVMCAGSISCSPPAAPPAGVLLITLDTVRADHVGCYGSPTAVTPNLDAFAAQSVRFEQAMTAVPTTLPSHSTMFTGQYPPVHGVRYNGMFKLGDPSVTIAERFRDAGFVTAAVVSSYPVNAKSGLSQGFATYRDIFSEPGGDALEPSAERKGADVTRLGLEAIKAASGKRFFVWLHYFEPHYPYEPPFPYSSSFREHPYDGEIAYVDAQLGALFAGLKSAGLWDQTVILIAGDHGEGLYEHGERMHAQLAYQTTLHVPLMVKSAQAKPGRVITEPVTLADVAPTLIDLAGLPVPPGLDGISLRDALRGQAPPPRVLYFETLSGSLNFGWSPIEGVRQGKWKLIRSSEPELYDLDKDAAETNNLYQTETEMAAELGATVDRELTRLSANGSPAEATAIPLDPGAASRLASIGYVGGSVAKTNREGPSPRKMVHLESELLLLQDEMMQDLSRQALQSTANILRDDPGNRLALSSAADASFRLSDFPAAKRYGQELLRRYPEFAPGWLTQGRIDVARKDYRSAEVFFRKGLEKSPDEASLAYSLALCLLAENRAREARPIIEEALAVPGADPSFRVILALSLALEGDAAGAGKELAQALAEGYSSVVTLQEEPLLAPLRKLPGFAQTIAAAKR